MHVQQTVLRTEDDGADRRTLQHPAAGDVGDGCAAVLLPDARQRPQQPLEPGPVADGAQQ